MPIKTLAAALLALATLASATPVFARDYAGGAVKSAALADGRQLLTDARGMTLYTFDKDKPGVSNCTGLCLLAWPPVKAAPGAKPAGDFTIVQTRKGPIWAFKGKPLYLFAFDRKPGEIKGDGSQGVWHAAIR